MCACPALSSLDLAPKRHCRPTCSADAQAASLLNGGCKIQHCFEQKAPHCSGDLFSAAGKAGTLMLQYTQNIEYAVLSTCLIERTGSGLWAEADFGKFGCFGSPRNQVKACDRPKPAQTSSSSSCNALCSLLEVAHVMTRPSVRSEPVNPMPTCIVSPRDTCFGGGAPRP